MDIDINALFHQAFVAASSSSRDADLTTEQKARVASLLVDPQHPTGDEILAIRTLGFAGATQYKELIKQYLYGPGAWTAMYVLSKYWDMEGEIAQQLRMIMRGVPWDSHSGGLQFLATAIVGEYLNDHRNDEMLNDLLMLCEDSSEETFVTNNVKHEARHMIRNLLWRDSLPPNMIEKVERLVTLWGT